MDILFNDILTHLKNFTPDKNIDISDFIHTDVPDSNEYAVVVIKTLQSLISKRLINAELYRDQNTLLNINDGGIEWLRMYPTYTTKNLTILASITIDGLKDIEQITRDNRQDDLLNRQTLAAEKSGQAVMDAGDFTRKSTNKSLLLAVISSLFILASVILTILDKTPQRLQDIKTELQNTNKSLDTLRISVEDLKSSIQKITTDTILVKRKKK